VVVILAGVVVQRRGPAIVRGTYTKAVTPFAVLVLAIMVLTSILMR